MDFIPEITGLIRTAHTFSHLKINHLLHSPIITAFLWSFDWIYNHIRIGPIVLAILCCHLNRNNCGVHIVHAQVSLPTGTFLSILYIAHCTHCSSYQWPIVPVPVEYARYCSTFDHSLTHFIFFLFQSLQPHICLPLAMDSSMWPPLAISTYEFRIVNETFACLWRTFGMWPVQHLPRFC